LTLTRLDDVGHTSIDIVDLRNNQIRGRWFSFAAIGNLQADDQRDADPNRPLPTVTFSDKYTLRVGNQVLELSYHGNAHEPGNIFIYAPAQRVLMVVDVVFPGWMPWRRFALAQDIPGYFAQVEEIRKMDWDTFVGGHVARTGTHADVDIQAEFNNDVKQAAATALANTKPGEGLNPLDKNNPWAFFDHYIDRVAAQCVNTLTPKWSTKLGGFDVYVWDQCYSMEQTLRIEQLRPINAPRSIQPAASSNQGSSWFNPGSHEGSSYVQVSRHHPCRHLAVSAPRGGNHAVSGQLSHANRSDERHQPLRPSRRQGSGRSAVAWLRRYG
jgi:hypothetical protein